jgi:phenylpropionate dioxygenase-like ring-hydroxylating dioxygenase large terminal subunit
MTDIIPAAAAAAAAAVTDRIALDAWYAVAAVDELRPGAARIVTLLGARLAVTRGAGGEIVVEIEAGDGVLPVRLRFGYVWTTLGAPAADVFAIPEYDETDRRNLNAGSVGVRTSAPRVVENFLDMGHLPIVHTDYLGVEARAEIAPYRVEVTTEPDQILATRCRIFQPMASLAATQGFEVDYTFRVPHPYCAVLYKSSAIDPTRNDVIAIFVQPVDEDHSVAHMLVSGLDRTHSNQAIRAFQQFIFGQDRPILENQIPARLPLDPRAEIPIRIDATSSAYRRWLRQKGVRYGVLA